jgi:hypothetical protein
MMILRAIMGGSAYIFKQTNGTWSQQDKFVPEDNNDYDRLGNSVAISGDATTAIIGARTDEEPNGTSAGSTYVYTQSDGDWTQQAKLAADDGDRGDNFGYSVVVSNDSNIAIISAYGDEDPNGFTAGSAYVFGL